MKLIKQLSFETLMSRVVAYFSFKRIVSLLILCCFLLSFEFGQGFAIILEERRETSKFEKSFNDFVLPFRLGRITDCYTARDSSFVISDSLKSFANDEPRTTNDKSRTPFVIIIQDLHCHPEVQNNISKILELIDSKFNISRVYQEGAIGDVNTSWLGDINEKKLRLDIINALTSGGLLTGAEYYSSISGKYGLIKGLENEQLYRENVLRLNRILENRSDILEILSEIKIEIENIEKLYCGKKNKRLEKVIKEYRTEKINARKYYGLVRKYGEKTGVDINSFINITAYLELTGLEKKIDYRKVSLELGNFIALLKQKLPYNAYKLLAEQTKNFSMLDEFFVYITKLKKDYDLRINFAEDFSHLNKFADYIALSQKINPLNLIKEERKLIRELQTRLSDNESERETVFLSDFVKSTEDFYANKISADEYEYFTDNIKRFDSLYNKYTDSDKLTKLQQYFKVLSDYYRVNIERTGWFVENILEAGRGIGKDKVGADLSACLDDLQTPAGLSVIPAPAFARVNSSGGIQKGSVALYGRDENNPPVSPFSKGGNNLSVSPFNKGGIKGDSRNFDDTQKTIASLKDSEIKVVVCGGFHTSGFVELLKEKKISYLVITPNVTQDTKFSETVYTRLIEQQGKILSQTLAVALISQDPPDLSMIEMLNTYINSKLEQGANCREISDKLNEALKDLEKKFGKKTFELLNAKKSRDNPYNYYNYEFTVISSGIKKKYVIENGKFKVTETGDALINTLNKYKPEIVPEKRQHVDKVIENIYRIFSVFIIFLQGIVGSGASGLNNLAGNNIKLFYSGIEKVSDRNINFDTSKPVVAVFDLHGTLLKPTWKDEYADAYIRLTGKDGEDAKKWVNENTIFVSDDEIAMRLSKAAGKTIEETKEAMYLAHKHMWDDIIPEAMPGALEFVRELHNKGVPIVVVSGSLHSVAVNQLDKRGFLEYISNENIIARDDVSLSRPSESFDKHKYRKLSVESIVSHFPGYRLAHFNDTDEGFALISQIDGINFGLPQGENEERKTNREMLEKGGVDFVLDGWHNWKGLINLLGISDTVQKKERFIEVSNDRARELPLVLPAQRKGGLSLHIAVSDDLKELKYLEVHDDSLVFRKDGTVDYGVLEPKEKLVAKFPSSYLLSPERYMWNRLEGATKRTIERIWKMNKRYTTYRGITVSWDKEVDKDVWTTSIDTLYFHKSIEDSGLLNKKSIKKVIEIGTGGGHISCLLVSKLPKLEEISITDISFYALRAAKRSIMPYLSRRLNLVRLRTYLGKGFGSVKGAKADLIVINPPYIPSPPWENAPHTDPYRGTGLIREILEKGIFKLNPKNPEASIVINISSIANKDLIKYLTEINPSSVSLSESAGGVEISDEFLSEFNKSNTQWTIEKMGKSLKVPLKVKTIMDNKRWTNWLVEEGVLEYDRESETDKGREPYWHTLQMYKITPKPGVIKTWSQVEAYVRLIARHEFYEFMASQIKDSRIRNAFFNYLSIQFYEDSITDSEIESKMTSENFHEYIKYLAGKNYDELNHQEKDVFNEIKPKELMRLEPLLKYNYKRELKGIILEKIVENKVEIAKETKKDVEVNKINNKNISASMFELLKRHKTKGTRNGAIVVEKGCPGAEVWVIESDDKKLIDAKASSLSKLSCESFTSNRKGIDNKIVIYVNSIFFDAILEDKLSDKTAKKLFSLLTASEINKYFKPNNETPVLSELQEFNKKAINNHKREPSVIENSESKSKGKGKSSLLNSMVSLMLVLILANFAASVARDKTALSNDGIIVNETKSSITHEKAESIIRSIGNPKTADLERNKNIELVRSILKFEKKGPNWNGREIFWDVIWGNGNRIGLFEAEKETAQLAIHKLRENRVKIMSGGMEVVKYVENQAGIRSINDLEPEDYLAKINEVCPRLGAPFVADMLGIHVEIVRTTISFLLGPSESQKILLKAIYDTELDKTIKLDQITEQTGLSSGRLSFDIFHYWGLISWDRTITEKNKERFKKFWPDIDKWPSKKVIVEAIEGQRVESNERTEQGIEILARKVKEKKINIEKINDRKIEELLEDLTVLSYRLNGFNVQAGNGSIVHTVKNNILKIGRSPLPPRPLLNNGGIEKYGKNITKYSDMIPYMLQQGLLEPFQNRYILSKKMFLVKNAPGNEIFLKDIVSNIKQGKIAVVIADNGEIGFVNRVSGGSQENDVFEDILDELVLYSDTENKHLTNEQIRILNQIFLDGKFFGYFSTEEIAALTGKRAENVRQQFMGMKNKGALKPSKVDGVYMISPKLRRFIAENASQKAGVVRIRFEFKECLRRYRYEINPTLTDTHIEMLTHLFEAGMPLNGFSVKDVENITGESNENVRKHLSNMHLWGILNGRKHNVYRISRNIVNYLRENLEPASLLKFSSLKEKRTVRENIGKLQNIPILHRGIITMVVAIILLVFSGITPGYALEMNAVSPETALPLPPYLLGNIEYSVLGYLTSMIGLMLGSVFMAGSDEEISETDEKMDSNQVIAPVKFQDLSEKFDELIEREDLKYGLKGFGLKDENPLQHDLYDALFEIFKKNNLDSQVSGELALSLSQMNNGSIEIMFRTGVLNEEERNILAGDNPAEKMMNLDELKKQEFAGRLAWLVYNDYKKLVYSKSKMSAMKKLLIPVEVVDYIQNRYLLSEKDTLEIIKQNPDFPVWLPKAQAKVNEIKRIIGDNNKLAWRIVIAIGVENAVEWVAGKLPEVKSKSHRKRKMEKEVWKELLRIYDASKTDKTIVKSGSMATIVLTKELAEQTLFAIKDIYLNKQSKENVNKIAIVLNPTFLSRVKDENTFTQGRICSFIPQYLISRYLAINAEGSEIYKLFSAYLDKFSDGKLKQRRTEENFDRFIRFLASVKEDKNELWESLAELKKLLDFRKQVIDDVKKSNENMTSESGASGVNMQALGKDVYELLRKIYGVEIMMELAQGKLVETFKEREINEQELEEYKDDLSMFRAKMRLIGRDTDVKVSDNPKLIQEETWALATVEVVAKEGKSTTRKILHGHVAFFEGMKDKSTEERAELCGLLVDHERFEHHALRLPDSKIGRAFTTYLVENLGLSEEDALLPENRTIENFHKYLESINSPQVKLLNYAEEAVRKYQEKLNVRLIKSVFAKSNKDIENVDAAVCVKAIIFLSEAAKSNHNLINQDIIEKVLKLSYNDNPFIRRAIITVLADIAKYRDGSEKLLERIYEMLSDRNPYIYETAESALKELAGRNPKYRKILAPQIENGQQKLPAEHIYKMMDEGDPEVRKEATIALIERLKVNVGGFQQSQEMVEHIIAKLGDENDDVCKTASEGLVELSQIRKELIISKITNLFAKMNSNKQNMQKNMLSVLGKTVEVWYKDYIAEDIVRQMRRKLFGAEKTLYRHAAAAMGMVSCKMPELIDMDIVNRLLELSGNGDYLVLNGLGNIAKAKPEYTELVVNHLYEKMDSQEWYIKKISTAVMGEILIDKPEFITQEIFERIYINSNDIIDEVRDVSFKVLADIAIIKPQYGPRVVSHLIEKMEDRSYWDANKIVPAVLGKIAQHINPGKLLAGETQEKTSVDLAPKQYSWLKANAPELYGKTVVHYYESFRSGNIEEIRELNELGVNNLCVLSYIPESSCEKIGEADGGLEIFISKVMDDKGRSFDVLCSEGLSPEQLPLIIRWLENTPQIHREIAVKAGLTFNEIKPVILEINEASSVPNSDDNLFNLIRKNTAIIYRGEISETVIKANHCFDDIAKEKEFDGYDVKSRIENLILKVYQPALIKKNSESAARPGANSGEIVLVSALRGEDFSTDTGIGELSDLDGYAQRLEEAGKTTLQILPLTQPAKNSPIEPLNLFAGDYALLKLKAVNEIQDLIKRKEIDENGLYAPDEQKNIVNREEITKNKFEKLVKACRLFYKKNENPPMSPFVKGGNKEYEEYLGRQSYWLDSYARFMAGSKLSGVSALQLDENGISKIENANKESFEDYVKIFKYIQWLFDRQMREAISKIHKRGCTAQFWQNIDKDNCDLAITSMKHWFRYGFDGVRIDIKDKEVLDNGKLEQIMTAINRAKPDADVIVRFPDDVGQKAAENLCGKFGFKYVLNFGEIASGSKLTQNVVVEMDSVDADYRPHRNPDLDKIEDTKEFYRDRLNRVKGAAGVFSVIGNIWGDDWTLMYGGSQLNSPLWNYRVPCDGETNNERVKWTAGEFARELLDFSSMHRQFSYENGKKIGLEMFKDVSAQNDELEVLKENLIFDPPLGENLNYDFSKAFDTAITALNKTAQKNGINRKYWIAASSHIKYLSRQMENASSIETKVSYGKDMLGFMQALMAIVTGRKYIEAKKRENWVLTKLDREIFNILALMVDSLHPTQNIEVSGKEGIPAPVKNYVENDSQIASLLPVLNLNVPDLTLSDQGKILEETSAKAKTFVQVTLYAKALMRVRAQQGRTKKEVDDEVREAINPLLSNLIREGVYPEIMDGETAEVRAWAIRELFGIFDNLVKPDISGLKEAFENAVDAINIRSTEHLKSAA